LSTKSERNQKAEQLQWRRSKVIELRSRGLSQIEIAHELHVSEASISSDMQYLRGQAKGTIKEYVTDHLPEQYQLCLVALDSIIKRAFDIIETSEDNRDRLQAMQLFEDTHITKLELLSNATTIDSALNFIRSKQTSQEQHKKESDDGEDDRSDSKSDNRGTTTPATTTTATGKQSVF
jgi:predicted transcriptional regulator